MSQSRIHRSAALCMAALLTLALLGAIDSLAQAEAQPAGALTQMAQACAPHA